MQDVTRNSYKVTESLAGRVAFLTAIEIKFGKTFTPDFFRGLESRFKFSEDEPEHCMLIYAGELRLTHQGIVIASWDNIE